MQMSFLCFVFFKKNIHKDIRTVYSTHTLREAIISQLAMHTQEVVTLHITDIDSGELVLNNVLFLAPLVVVINEKFCKMRVKIFNLSTQSERI